MKTTKTIFAAAIFLMGIACANPPEEKTSTEEFTELSNDQEFVEKHEEPEDINPDLKGSMIKIEVEGGEAANAYLVKNETETNKYLFVIHEWWGLNNHIKQEADRLFGELEGIHVMALDLYDSKVTDNREDAQKYMSSADEVRIQAIIAAALKKVGPEAEIATIGWCFGGGWSLRTALQAGNQTQACVMYYGMPVQDVEKLKQLNSDVLFIYGTQDEWINTEVAENFKKNMKAAGKNLEVLAFDADHAFANPSGQHYLEEAAQDANLKAYFFLKERIN